MKAIKTLMMLFLVLLFSCASQSSSLKSASGETCTIDLKQTCEARAKGSIISADTGLTNDAAMTEQNSPSTVSISFSLVEGDQPVELFCDINARRRTVVYAHLGQSKSLSDAQIAKLRIEGYCSEGAAGQ